LTGTLNIEEAARRVIAWAAMADAPERWHRASNFYLVVAKWAESLVYESVPGKRWRLFHKPFDWVMKFVEGALQKNSATTKGRPAYLRDHYFLKRREEGAEPRQIRDEWNAMTDEQRIEICPPFSGKVKDGPKGIEVVKNAIKVAKREEGDDPASKPR
jgi:hypothetical protein